MPTVSIWSDWEGGHCPTWQPQAPRPLGGQRGEEELARGGGKVSGKAAPESGLQDGGEFPRETDGLSALR